MTLSNKDYLDVLRNALMEQLNHNETKKPIMKPKVKEKHQDIPLIKNEVNSNLIKQYDTIGKGIYL